MDNTIYSLVYLSRNAIEGSESSLRQEVEDILAVSRTNNAECGLTGALMFNAGCFAQVLEGAHDALQETFERIQCDMRHDKVVILAFKEAKERKFSSWSMAYLGKQTQAADKFADIARSSGFDPSAVDGDRIFGLLEEHMAEAEATTAGESM